jgi:hypothetical protein
VRRLARLATGGIACPAEERVPDRPLTSPGDAAAWGVSLAAAVSNVLEKEGGICAPESFRSGGRRNHAAGKPFTQ